MLPLLYGVILRTTRIQYNYLVLNGTLSHAGHDGLNGNITNSDRTCVIT